MSDCWICAEKEQSLRQAVLAHWHAVRQFRAALENSEDLSPCDVNMHATQVKMDQAEDSYRQHLRLMHETTVDTTTSPVSTFTRFYARGKSQVVGN